MQFSPGNYPTKPGVCARLVSQEPSNETLKRIPTDAQKGTNFGFLIANKEHYMVLLIIAIARLPGQPPL